MRYLVNLAHLDPPVNGGASRLAREVVRGLISEFPGQLVFLVRSRFVPRFWAWLGIKHFMPVIPYNRYLSSHLILRLTRPNVVISPLFGVEPFSKAGMIPHVVSIPDALALDHPELLSTSEAMRRSDVYWRATSAIRIITLSKYASTQLRQHLALAPEQVQVIPLGAAPSSEEIHSRLVSDPYLYYPANNWSHKRHNLLFHTMSIIRQVRPDLKLMLSGGRSSQVDLKKLATQWGLLDVVNDLGYISEKEVYDLYRHAEAMLFTSQYEGFGMPLLEAMQAGCPVICAPVTAIPEVAGDAALYVAGDNADDWASAFLKQLPLQRENLVQRGYQRAAQFTWEETRRMWIDVIHQTLNETYASG